jgi:hypothetical protein
MPTSVATLESAYRDAREAQRAARVRKDDALKALNGELGINGRRKTAYTVAPAKDKAKAKKDFQVASAAYARAARTANLAREDLVGAGGDPLTVDGVARTAAPAAPARPNGATRAEPIYVPGGKHNFWRDLVAMRTDPGAAERLRRNDLVMGAERRDTDTSTGAGFLPPGYLADKYSLGVRPAAVVRSACTRVEMPPAGIGTAHIPSVTVGVTVSGQADVDSDNLSATSDPETAYADSGMATFAASIKVDRQVFERGFAVGLEADAFAELDSAIDLQMIAGTAGSGNAAGYDGLINASGAGSYTYTDASPSAAKLFDALYKAQAQFAETRDAPAEYVLMHPRRAYYLAGGRDTSFPLYSQGGLASGASDASWSAGPLSGLRALVSSNVPTDVSSDQDVICLFRGSDVLYAMTEARFAFVEAASSMNAVVFQAVTYTYFWANRHNGADVLVVSGTGLTPPS